VVDDQVPVGVVDAGPLLDQRAELVVVVVATLDGLGEDRGVGGDAPDAVLHPALQLAAGEVAALEVVEPRALTLFPIELLQFGHAEDPSFLATRALACTATFSPVKPSFSKTMFPGADAPNRSM